MKKVQTIIKIMCVISVLLCADKKVVATTDLSGSSLMLTSNTTWTLSGSPYVVDLVHIDNGAVLTIEPGVIVKFTYGGVDQLAQVNIVDGAIVANGTEANPIIFTSYSDDVGGDTNGDGNLSEPQVYDWNGIYFSDTLSSAMFFTLFNNVQIKYSEFGLKIKEGTLTNIDFSHNNVALFLFGEDPMISNNMDFISNGVDLKLGGNRELVLSGYTFDTSEIAVVIQDNSHFICDECNFLGGYIGIIVGGDSDLTLTNSLIENYTSAGIFNQSVSQSLTSDPEDNEINISNSEIRNNDIGIEFGGDGYGAIVNNSIHDNDTFGVKFSDYDSPATVDLRNNWWGDASGPHELVGNPNGLGDNLQVQFIPYSPWTGQLSPMTLHQYKMDGEFELSEGDTNMSDKFVFKAKGSLVASPRKIELEIKSNAQSFDGMNTHVSDFQSNTDELIVDVSPVVKGSYKWRARVLDEGGVPGGWIEFGQTVGGVDFISKPIPHYTQNQSPYPDPGSTEQWRKSVYANGKSAYPGGCGNTIGSCGCALTSLVMLLRFSEFINLYGEDVNPDSLNEWLNQNNGYGPRGDLLWHKIAQFTNNQFKIVDSVNYETFIPTRDNSKLNQYLAQGLPVIARMTAQRKIPGQKGGGHFLVISNSLQDSYEIKDPAQYNTLTLNHVPGPNENHIRTYFNGYDGLRFFKPVTNAVAEAYTVVHMASPADVLVTDLQGRRVGRNPITGGYFQEIPGSYYVSDSIDDAEQENQAILNHDQKTAYIPNLGNIYDVDVFGTGDGGYTLDIDKVLSTGEEVTLTYTGEILENQIQPFSLNTNQNEIHLKDEKLDISAPTLLLSPAKAGDSKNWKLDGVDENMPITKNILNPERIFSVEDRYGNKTEIDFDDVPGYRIPAIGKINLELNHVTINGTAVQIPYTWISYDWNTSAGATTMFKQVFSIDQVFIDAVYTQATNQTVVSITNGNSTQIVTFPKLRILKFKTLPNGQPSYEL